MVPQSHADNADNLVLPSDKKSLNPWMLVSGVAAGLMLCVGVALGILSFFVPDTIGLSQDERVMPDGTILCIARSVTTSNSSWICEMTPPDLLGQFRRRKVTLKLDIPAGHLGIWMSRRSPGGVPLDLNFWSKSVIVDANGEEVPDQNAHFYQFSETMWSSCSRNPQFRSGSGAGGEKPAPVDTYLASSIFPAFRTNGGKFTLKVMNSSGELVAEFPLTHPSKTLRE